MRKLLICLSLLLAAAQGLAGEIHYGNGLSRESACENAERRARRAALSKNTCYEQCEVRDCKKEDDGSFTARRIPQTIAAVAAAATRSIRSRVEGQASIVGPCCLRHDYLECL